MTSHWVPPEPGKTGPSAITNVSSPARFELAFLLHGERTVIGRQFVSYPFHMTRPFALDPVIPSLLTVYQQSSSGGLYRAEHLSSRFQIGAKAAAHVTTQAATVVHDCHGQPAHQSTEIRLEEQSFLALTPDSLVLFPGASCVSRLEANVAPDAVLMLADSFTLHDPQEAARPFDRLASDTVIRNLDGRLLFRDCFVLAGEALTAVASPIGDWRVVSSFLLIGPPERLPAEEELRVIEQDDAAVAGVSPLPNEAGWGVRCLAADAVCARRVAERLFSACVSAALGNPPSLRRK